MLTRLFGGLLLLTGFVANAADHCVVLQYQHISDETPGVTSVSPDLFQDHLDFLLERARAARQAGATRFCMGAAWRNPTDTNLERVIEMVRGVKGLGMETCLTLGMLTGAQARRLKEAGLDYYNHNLDTSERYYEEIITTRTYQDRLDTLQAVRNARKSLDLAYYIFADDYSSSLLAQELIAAARRGVRVRVFLDYFNNYRRLDLFRFLQREATRGAGSLEVRLFSEAEIPWDRIAFPVVAETLRLYFRDRADGGYGTHMGDGPTGNLGEVGIVGYRSTDLMNWEPIGTLLPEQAEEVTKLARMELKVMYEELLDRPGA